METTTGFYNNESIVMVTPLHYILSQLKGLKAQNAPQEQHNKFFKMFYSILEKTSIDNLNKVSHDGNTVLHEAAQLGDTNLILTLLEKDVDATILNKYKETAVDIYVKNLEHDSETPRPVIIELFTDAMVKPISNLSLRNYIRQFCEY